MRPRSGLLEEAAEAAEKEAAAAREVVRDLESVEVPAAGANAREAAFRSVAAARERSKPREAADKEFDAAR